ncbi:UbiA-like polyprenyltransferase [Phycisphaera mikurensis]|uniref:Putative 4-hydroxybenzoate polyprenyltransferase n=1 Tax=Phycisphaera mikurensis (strain NBRC 102666 / KCTC 22515 / FYK2301M01) TaxID=1142394 RepID=I0IA84_PHYMF|nr:UbiA-like polyprenyltransferase [Phycisphaera mikurensis]MBB6441826.1 4-hydroxybenzoate polyprenyltransferase [Phycisphaera mikurensis]BAM02172.1 putative 4-hydroxybenzoate polyprenyltransferase [Phycisphaera mikurensis NBRC 102666]
MLTPSLRLFVSSSLASSAALARDIKLSHSVFALPFGLLGMALAAASAGRWPTPGELLLVLACMVTARTFAMTVNRVADAGFDAQNPRTAGRAIPAGRLSAAFAGGAIVVSAVLFVAAAAGFWFLRGNLWPVALALPVLGWLALYSFTKRFTAWCHVVLGVALAVSPVAAALAVEPAYAATPGPWLLAGFVAGWVAGFDVLYALADREVDARLGLRSVPARFGAGGAVAVSRALHALAFLSLAGLNLAEPRLGPLFAGATTLALALLLCEQWLVRGGRLERLGTAFLTVNGVLGLLLGVAGVAEALRGVGATAG